MLSRNERLIITCMWINYAHLCHARRERKPLNSVTRNWPPN